MTEEYLHFIWDAKRFDILALRTTKRASFAIEHFGIHNTLLAGPDFTNAAVRFKDVVEYGPIEIHVKSSDWYLHKHESDRAYDNVILHVVYEHDREIIQNGRLVPTLELKNRIDVRHFQRFEQFRKNQHAIICGSQLMAIDPIFIHNMIDKALLDKIHAKIKVVVGFMKDPADAMYYFLGAAFGANLNVFPFLQLLQSVPSNSLRKMQPAHRYQWLLLQSGMTDASQKQFKERWHFKGNRPGNFPTKRLLQFAHYLCDEQLALLIELESPEELIAAFHEIIQEHAQTVRLSATFKNHILINAVVPYLVFRAQLDQNAIFQERAFELLERLPPEINAITKKWQAHGFPLKNARESQGLLALHRYYCTAKKCLSCEVGTTILGNSRDK